MNLPTPLLLAALLLGLAATPHCAAMCGVASTAACAGSGRRGTAMFQLARLLAYSTAGAGLGWGSGLMADAARWSAALRPVWMLTQLGLLALGIWLVWQGRLPARMSTALAGPAAGWQPLRFRAPGLVGGPAPATGRALLAGLAWVGWPCGVMQSAWVMAALAGSVAGGALVMAVFAAASAPGLLVAPWLWARLKQRGLDDVRASRWAVRGAGLATAAAAAWALSHGLWARVLVACGWG